MTKYYVDDVLEDGKVIKGCVAHNTLEEAIKDGELGVSLEWTRTVDFIIVESI